MSFAAIKWYSAYPRAIFAKLSAMRLLDWVSDEVFLKLRWSPKEMGYSLDLKTPKGFNEKLQWLKLHNRNPLYTIMADKYAAKAYVAEKIGWAHIIPVLGGPWQSADEIDFDALPEQFVLKCNHDCGSVVVCTDKRTLDRAAVRKKMNEALGRNYFWSSREWPYKNIEPCIFAEQYMEDTNSSASTAQGLVDYKFYCFNGEPKFFYLGFANMVDGVKRDQLSFKNLDWTPAEFYRKDHEQFPFTLEKPREWARMVEIAKSLSAGIPFVRVDLFCINEQIYFSELTFSPGGGLGRFYPDEWERRMGDWIDLSSAYEFRREDLPQ